MKVVSLFSGCGGLDLGFTNADFEVIYANDSDPAVWDTYKRNHQVPKFDRRSFFDIKAEEIPDADGFIGGPPCQSWSLAGEMRGKRDERGKLFFKYIGALKEKRPKFFLIENVPGIISKAHLNEFNKILIKLSCLGYNLTFKCINAADYGVPQIRRRVFIVGYQESLGIRFTFPQPSHSRDGKTKTEERIEKWVSLEETISGMPDVVQALEKNKANSKVLMKNHEYMIGKFSYIYMSRNRRKLWNEPSFTIQASGRHAPLHPSSSEMVKVEKDVCKFVDEDKVNRRLTVRECARIQTFPDKFTFYYTNVADGYKMVGNAVPVKLAEVIAKRIKTDIKHS